MLVKPFIKPVISFVAGTVVGCGGAMLFNNFKAKKAKEEAKDEIDENIDELNDTLENASEVLNAGNSKIDQMTLDNEEFIGDNNKKYESITDTILNGGAKIKNAFEEFEEEFKETKDKIEAAESEVDDLPDEITEEECEDADTVESEVDDLPDEIMAEEGKDSEPKNNKKNATKRNAAKKKGR